jgi:DNA ligase-1
MWKAGEAVPFLLLARTFEACSETSKRLEKDVLLTNALRSIIASTPDDLLPAVYLATCTIAPAYQSMKLGIGEQTIVKALAEATGRSEASVKEQHDKIGDLGIIAQQCRSTQRIMFQPAPLTIRGVFATLREIARTEGEKSTEKKRAAIKCLLVASRDVEPGYIVRLLLGDLRVGLQQQTVISSIAHAALLQEEASSAGGASSGVKGASLADRLNAADALLKQVYSECPSWDLILPSLLRDGVQQLPQTCHFVPGIPIKPMLAKATYGASRPRLTMTATA